MKKYTFTITGFHCSSCTKISEVMLRKIQGVTGVSINAGTGETRVTSESELPTAHLIETVEKLGYHLTNLSYESLS